MKENPFLAGQNAYEHGVRTPKPPATLWLLEIIGALEATSYMRTHAAFRITAGGRELLATLKRAQEEAEA